MRFGSETLLLIPCCAKKRAGGGPWDANLPAVADTFDSETYDILISARRELLLTIKELPAYSKGKYAKNMSIALGPDFGGDDGSGQYRPALERYTGSLYKAETNWSAQVAKALLNRTGPKLLIQSALYGLLHPWEPIQDYNLQTSDIPAKTIWSHKMPCLLKAFVERMNIQRIIMYFGGSTTYFRIAVQAVKPLLQSVKLKEVLHYNVERGNAYHTPHNHGLILLRDLTGKETSGYTRPINLRKIDV